MDELLRLCRRYLHYPDDSEDENIKEYILDGMDHLNHIAGRGLDYSIPGPARSLLKDYVRYANSQALEVFDTNFERELLDLHLVNQEDPDAD